MTHSGFNFSYQRPHPNNRARLGTLSTPHGDVATPAFIFCATKAAIKAVSAQHMVSLNTQIILSNTYHLMLQPGSKRVQNLGGLHRFMGWHGPMLTDSGGFQVFSLGHGSVASEIKGQRTSSRPKSVVAINEDGVTFKSYLDGQKQHLTPERSIQVQCELGADLIVVFDECTPFHVDESYTAESMRRSHRWALRSQAALMSYQNAYNHSAQQALYGIIQGGIYPHLRAESCAFVNEHSFFGHAIGGSLGATHAQMDDVVAMCMSQLTPERPVHLLGIGGVRDIFAGVRQGIDTFDCVHPTRLARHGGALIPAAVLATELGSTDALKEHINLKNARFADDTSPLDPTCTCPVCQTASRGYIHHLLKAGEILGLQLLSMHNIFFMNRLLEAIRSAIRDQRLDDEQKFWLG